MELGMIAGITGLSKSVDRVAEAQRGLGTLQQLDNGIQKDKAENLMMQEMEAKQYEEIEAKSSELLERDRIAIKAKSIALQADVRSKIQAAGSRKAFFESGGLALLSKYKTDLLTSEENLRYKDNKANMTKILALQEAGKGGLLSKIDLKNLNEYNEGKSDKITYSGLKSEIEVPSNEHNYGEEIMSAKILHNKNNYMAIYANFALENPSLKGLKGQELEEMLLTYTKENYGGQGLNQLKMQQENSRKEFERQNKAIKDAGTPQEDNKIPFTTNINNTLNNAGSVVPKTIDSIVGTSNYIDNLRGENGNADALFGGKSNAYNEAAPAIKQIGIGKLFTNIGEAVSKGLGINDTYAPASAYKILPLDKKTLNSKLFNGANPDGTVNISLNTSDYYNTNGEKLEQSQIDSVFDGVGMANVSNYFVGWEDENGKLMTNILDSKGKPYLDSKGNPDQSKINDHRKGYSGVPKHNLYATLKDAEGNVFYQRFDMNSLQGDTAISNALGMNNNLAPVVKEANQYDAKKQKAAEVLSMNKTAIYDEVNKASTETGAFQKPEFISEARMMQVQDGEKGTQDRTAMLKAFYLAANDDETGGQMSAKNLSSSNRFGTFSKQINNFPKLKDASISKNKYSDVAFIDLFAETVSDGDPEHQSENSAFATKWKAYYNLILKNK